MNGLENLNATERLAKHLEQINDYLDLSNVRFSGFHEDFLEGANLSRSRLKTCTQQELFDWAFTIYGYASYIQDEINKNRVVKEWCEDQIEKLVARNMESFSQYTKHETKRQSIIKEDSYAAKCDQMLSVADARLQSLEGKVYELKRKGDILLEKGKRL